MRRLLIVLGAAGLLASGCGGGGGSSSPAGQTSSGAGMIPESAPAVIAVNTDFDGGQVKALRDLLNKLPGKAKIYAQLRQALASQGADFERDVKPAIGPETDLVFLNLENGISGAVAITKPPNKAKFQALAAKGDNTQKTADLEDGWMAAADSEALLTRYQELAKKGKLADSGTYKDATANLPGDALAKVFVDGSTLSSLLKKRGLGSAPVVGGNLDWVSGALTAESKGLALDIKVHGDKISTGTYSAGLLKEIPAGALAVLSFNDQRGTIEGIAGSPQLRGQASQIEAAAGVSLEKIAALFGGEGALYVRPGSPLPEITLALEPPNQSEALSTVKTLAKRLGRLLGGGGKSRSAYWPSRDLIYCSTPPTFSSQPLPGCTRKSARPPRVTVRLISLRPRCASSI